MSLSVMFMATIICLDSLTTIVIANRTSSGDASLTCGRITAGGVTTMKHSDGASLIRPRSRSTLKFCVDHWRSTCCNESVDKELLFELRGMFESAHEITFSRTCIDASRIVKCWICCPKVGTHQINGVCPQLCDRWWNACRRDYFTAAGVANGIGPCSSDSIICSPLENIVNSGNEFCERMGIRVRSSDDEPVGVPCYDGTISIITTGNASYSQQQVFSQQIVYLFTFGALTLLATYIYFNCTKPNQVERSGVCRNALDSERVREARLSHLEAMVKQSKRGSDSSFLLERNRLDSSSGKSIRSASLSPYPSSN